MSAEYKVTKGIYTRKYQAKNICEVGGACVEKQRKFGKVKCTLRNFGKAKCTLRNFGKVKCYLAKFWQGKNYLAKFWQGKSYLVKFSQGELLMMRNAIFSHHE